MQGNWRYIRPDFPELYRFREHSKKPFVCFDSMYSKVYSVPQNKARNSYDSNVIEAGTNRADRFIQGFSGHTPFEKWKISDNKQEDIFVGSKKTLHLENFNSKIPGYAGHSPRSIINLKNIERKFCLSTKNN